MARTTGGDAVLAMYALFDDEASRERRRWIWKELSQKEPSDLTTEEWDVVERTATAMDVVGTMLKHDFVKRDLIFERYTEVILPLWDAMNRHIEYRRMQKGKHGWTNFEWLVRSCRTWSLAVRGTDTYQRF